MPSECELTGESSQHLTATHKVNMETACKSQLPLFKAPQSKENNHSKCTHTHKYCTSSHTKSKPTLLTSHLATSARHKVSIDTTINKSKRRNPMLPNMHSLYDIWKVQQNIPVKPKKSHCSTDPRKHTSQRPKNMAHHIATQQQPNAPLTQTDHTVDSNAHSVTTQNGRRKNPHNAHLHNSKT